MCIKVTVNVGFESKFKRIQFVMTMALSSMILLIKMSRWFQNFNLCEMKCCPCKCMLTDNSVKAAQICALVEIQSTDILTASLLFRSLSLNIVAYSRLSLARYFRNIL